MDRSGNFYLFNFNAGLFAVNGILTGSVIESPVVNYNPNEF